MVPDTSQQQHLEPSADDQMEILMGMHEAGILPPGSFVHYVQEIVQKYGPIKSEALGDRVKEAMAHA